MVAYSSHRDRKRCVCIVVDGRVGISELPDEWKQGVGWGWVWGSDDEVGSLNEMTDRSRLSAVRLVKAGRVFDLGIANDRTFYKWLGHIPDEIMSFRTPEGTKRQADLDFIPTDGLKKAWHSSALFMYDSVAPQTDSLCHATMGEDNHWYNGFKEAEWGGDWGGACDATKIPPIVSRVVMIDVAKFKGRKVLPSNYAITNDDWKGALRKQDLRTGRGSVREEVQVIYAGTRLPANRTRRLYSRVSLLRSTL